MVDKISVIARDIGIEEEYNPTIIENIIFLRIDNREQLKISDGDSWRNKLFLLKYKYPYKGKFSNFY